MEKTVLVKEYKPDTRVNEKKILKNSVIDDNQEPYRPVHDNISKAIEGDPPHLKK